MMSQKLWDYVEISSMQEWEVIFSEFKRKLIKYD